MFIGPGWMMAIALNLIFYILVFAGMLKLPDIPKDVLVISSMLILNLMITMVITSYLIVSGTIARFVMNEEDKEDEKYLPNGVSITKREASMDSLKRYLADDENEANTKIVQRIVDAVEDEDLTIVIWYNKFQQNFSLRYGGRLITSSSSVEDLLSLFSATAEEEPLTGYDDDDCL